MNSILPSFSLPPSVVTLLSPGGLQVSGISSPFLLQAKYASCIIKAHEKNDINDEKFSSDRVLLFLAFCLAVLYVLEMRRISVYQVGPAALLFLPQVDAGLNFDVRAVVELGRRTKRTRKCWKELVLQRCHRQSPRKDFGGLNRALFSKSPLTRFSKEMWCFFCFVLVGVKSFPSESLHH